MPLTGTVRSGVRAAFGDRSQAFANGDVAVGVVSILLWPLLLALPFATQRLVEAAGEWRSSRASSTTGGNSTPTR